MNYLPFLIAKRLHLKQDKNNTILLISILSKVGISIIVFALIMSLSALNGFYILLNKNILSTLPHGIIQLPNESTLKWQDIIKKLKNFSGISYCEPYITVNGILEKNTKIKPIEIKIFSNIQYLKKDFDFNNKNIFFSKKKDNDNYIILSSHLAKYLSVKKNDSIKLFFLNHKQNKMNFDIEYLSLKIKYIFESNGILDSNIGYIPFSLFKKIFNKKYIINTIELHMSDPFNADKIIVNAAKKIGIPLFIYTWISDYKFIYHDIKIMKITVYLLLLLLIIISCFNITSISFMTISKKIRDIAILRSIGANNYLIQIIFLYYGLRSVMIGALIGLFTAVLMILNFKKILFFLEKYFKDNILLNNVYYNNFFLLQLNILDVIIIFTSIIFIGIITNWYPAYHASKINPSKILKEH